MHNNTLTVTVVANITANYGEGIGNISTVHKIYKNGKAYAIRSHESLKHEIMEQSGFYDGVQVVVQGTAQKKATEEYNAANSRAYESGYLTSGKNTYSRKSSFCVSDAVAVNSFNPELRFHNNLHLASVYAEANGLNLQAQTDEKDMDDEGDKKEKKNPCGLMPYQYEYDRGLKCYSFTLFLDKIGIEKNFPSVAISNEEKASRVNTLLRTVKDLSLSVRGNLDDASPLFIVGGLTNRPTHVFENLISVKGNKIIIHNELKNKMAEGFSCGVVQCGIFDNESEIIEKLNAISVSEFFSNLEQSVNNYYGV